MNSRKCLRLFVGGLLLYDKDIIILCCNEYIKKIELVLMQFKTIEL